jgi:hypothetical protein
MALPDQRMRFLGPSKGVQNGKIIHSLAKSVHFPEVAISATLFHQNLSLIRKDKYHEKFDANSNIVHDYHYGRVCPIARTGFHD